MPTYCDISEIVKACFQIECDFSFADFKLNSAAGHSVAVVGNFDYFFTDFF